MAITTENNQLSKPGQLVHQFSLGIEQRDASRLNGCDDELRIALVEQQKAKARKQDEKIHRLNVHLDSLQPDDADSFQGTKQQLIEVMKQFQSLVPGDNSSALIPRNWKDVEKAVGEVSMTWNARNETTSGRVQVWMRKLCTGLHNHSAVLKLLPTESEYVSIFAGALTLVIKATANYNRIAESFAEGVVAINDAVATVQQQIVAYDSLPLQQLALRLYMHIFRYLVKFMTWHQQRSAKRFLQSFNESLPDRFKSDLFCVEKTCELISTQLNIHMAADVRKTHMLSEGGYENTQYIIKFAEVQAELANVRYRANQDMLHQLVQKTKEEVTQDFRSIFDEYWEKARRDLTGASVAAILERDASRQLALSPTKPSVSDVRSRSVSPNPGNPANSNADEKNMTRTYSGSDIAILTAPLEDFFSWTQIDPFSEIGVPFPIMSEPTFVSRLREFTTDTSTSQILYAYGPGQTQLDNLLRHSAASYASLARQARVPVVSYFVKISHEAPPGPRSRETVEMSALLYALIRQVVELLPTTFEIATKLDGARFAELDGTLKTWDQAIAVFADLVKCLARPLVLFVIDGLNLLEDDGRPYLETKLKKLLDTSRALVREEGERVVKMLFTTAGLSGALSQRLREEDIVACNTASPGPGRRGRQARRVLYY